MIEQVINMSLLPEVLTIGITGVVVGSMVPWLFRLVGYLADLIFIVTDT